MTKFYFIFLAFVLANCQSNNSNSSQSIENEINVVFNLESTGCMGKCPVYKLSITKDKSLIFEGMENTNVSGKKSKILTDQEYIEIIGLIDEVNWGKLKSRYESKMNDLPSYSFIYNTDESSFKVFQYGSDPQELTDMRKKLLSKVDNPNFLN